MTAKVATPAILSNDGTEEVFGNSRNDLRLTEALMRVARSLWPKKTAAELSYRAVVSQRTAENWLALKTGISGNALGALIACEEGLHFIEATLIAQGKALPMFWKRFKKRQRRENLRADLKRLQHEFDLNEATDD